MAITCLRVRRPLKTVKHPSSQEGDVQVGHGDHILESHDDRLKSFFLWGRVGHDGCLLPPPSPPFGSLPPGPCYPSVGTDGVYARLHTCRILGI